MFYARVKEYPEFLYTPTDYEDYPEQKSKEVLIPLWQQAFDWFRKEYNFDLCWKPMSMVGVTCYYDIEICHSKFVWDKPPKVTGKTFEEAREACLEKLIELCK